MKAIHRAAHKMNKLQARGGRELQEVLGNRGPQKLNRASHQNRNSARMDSLACRSRGEAPSAMFPLGLGRR
jgi:hypothetical protein